MDDLKIKLKKRFASYNNQALIDRANRDYAAGKNTDDVEYELSRRKRDGKINYKAEYDTLVLTKDTELKQSYKYYTEEELESSHLDASEQEKKRLTEELGRRREQYHNREKNIGGKHWIWNNNRLKNLPFDCRQKLIDIAKEDVKLCFDNNGMHDPICISMAEEAQDMEEYLG